MNQGADNAQVVVKRPRKQTYKPVEPKMQLGFIHNTADIRQTSSFLGILVFAIASTRFFLDHDFFHNERAAIFLYVSVDIFRRITKTITYNIRHLYHRNILTPFFQENFIIHRPVV